MFVENLEQRQLLSGSLGGFKVPAPPQAVQPSISLSYDGTLTVNGGSSVVGQYMSVVEDEFDPSYIDVWDGTHFRVFDAAKVERVVINGTPGPDEMIADLSFHRIPVTMNGQAGDDFMVGGTEPDTFNGGAGGYDEVSYGGLFFVIESDGNVSRLIHDCLGVTVTMNDGRANDGSFLPYLGIYENDNVLSSVEVLDGTDGDDRIYGNSSANELYGLFGDDTLYGLGGNDYVDGGFGVDALYGGFGNDVLYDAYLDDALIIDGGPGWDTAYIDGVVDQRASFDSVSGASDLDVTCNVEQIIVVDEFTFPTPG